MPINLPCSSVLISHLLKFEVPQTFRLLIWLSCPELSTIQRETIKPAVQSNLIHWILRSLTSQQPNKEGATVHLYCVYQSVLLSSLFSSSRYLCMLITYFVGWQYTKFLLLIDGVWNNITAGYLVLLSVISCDAVGLCTQPGVSEELWSLKRFRSRTEDPC